MPQTLFIAEFSNYLIHIWLQNIVLFFGLLDLHTHFIFHLVKLLIKSLMGALKLCKFLNEREDKYFLVLTHPTFRNIKHVKLIIFDSKTRPFDSLSPGPWFSAPKIYARFQHYVSDSSSPLLPASASSQEMNTEEPNQPKINYYYIHMIYPIVQPKDCTTHSI